MARQPTHKEMIETSKPRSTSQLFATEQIEYKRRIEQTISEPYSSNRFNITGRQVPRRKGAP